MVLLLLAAAPLPAAAGTNSHLVARDLEGQPLSGICFTDGVFLSKPTIATGTTEVDLPSGHLVGQRIEILQAPCATGSVAQTWLLLSTQINIPADSDSAAVMLMRRSAFRKMAADALHPPEARAPRASAPAVEDPKRALSDAAARHGLTADQLESAIRSFSETQDPRDQGIAALTSGQQYPQAEKLLKGAAEKQGVDYVETLRYLGATQYERGEYHDAADTFRKALAVGGEDTALLQLARCTHSMSWPTGLKPSP